MDPRTPVLVGIAAIEQRIDDPRGAREAYELMVDAIEEAARDAGNRELLTRADSIRVPRGFWQYPDPGRLVADQVGAKNARTTLAEIGVLQQTLLSDACRAIANGEEEVALVVGGEAKYRELRGRIEGVEVEETSQDEAEPDQLLVPKEPLFDDLELARGLMQPVRAFAVMDSALRYAEGQSIEAHQEEIARLISDGSKVAEHNPHAWKRALISVEQVRSQTPKNRMMAFPYSRLHNSDWNVDQAAGLIFCTAALASALDIPRDRWIFPLAASESNHVVPLSARDALDRSPGAQVAGKRVFELAGRAREEIEYRDLYSCFPAPVRVFKRELELADDKPFTVTGGMASAGGPLNNYVFQSTVRMAEVLREHPGSAGLVTCVSGFMNKVGFCIWSSEPPEFGFKFSDVSEEVARQSGSRELLADYRGEARVVGYTVGYDRGTPSEGIAVCELDDGRRTIATTRDKDLALAMTQEEFCGKTIRVGEAGELTID